MSSKKSEPHIAANLQHIIHAQGLAAEVGAAQHDREMVHGARGPPLLPQLSAYDLEKHITVEEAAAILSIHPETFEATYPHLIRKVSPRCRRVKLRDLLSEQRVNAA